MPRFVEIAYDELLHETENAALLVIDGEEVWIPWSQIEDGQEPKEEGGVLSVTKWIAKQNDLDYDGD